MPISRDSISAPLEAGTSLLATQQIPTRLNQALEYVSDRLVRKHLHLTLIVVRNELQSRASPSLASFDAHINSPNRELFDGEFSPAINTCSSSSSTSSSSSFKSTKSLSRTQWASLPSSPKAFKHLAQSPPTTPVPRTPTCVTPSTINPYNITLLHASTLTPRAERILRETIHKASKKFHIGSGWLPTTSMTNPSSTFGNLTNDLIRRSLHQNEILFTSEGLTLLSLDHVYQFKISLSKYSRISKDSCLFVSSEEAQALQEATDSLHRLVLAQSGKHISKGYLLRAYDHLSITHSSIVTINRNYQLCYGGPNLRSGIAITDERENSPAPQKISFSLQDVQTALRNKGEKPVVTLNTKLSGLPSLETGEGRVGPVTPNGFEDLTPVTRGEWCFLMVGEGWKEARRGEVVTC